jgi:hypothetical protein
MAGLDPAIHVFAAAEKKDVVARDFCANARDALRAFARA